MSESYLPYLTRLVLDGPDTIQLLERLVTCRTDTLNENDSVPGALLTPQGKVLADFILTRTHTGCLLDVSPEAADDLEKRLKLFRLRADVTITREETDLYKEDEEGRIRALLPAFGKDFMGTAVFPTDINLDLRGGIDYKKGCFVGQEVVSRMKRRGKIRKRTLMLQGENIAVGADIRAESKLIGKVTSATDNCALAVVRIDHLSSALENNLPLAAGETPVTFEAPAWLSGEIEALEA